MITVGDLPRFTMAGGFQFEGLGLGACPPPDRRGGLRAPCYAPALVPGSDWAGGCLVCAWTREVYVPSYPVSRRYVNNINVSNTTVNRTVINNVYNTTIIKQQDRQCNDVNYVNRNVPGAVAATTSKRSRRRSRSREMRCMSMSAPS